MKHKNTTTPSAFANNRVLHELTLISDDTALSKICGGYGISEFDLKQLLLPFLTLIGLGDEEWYPAALITSIPLVTALIAIPAYISHKVTKKNSDKKLKEKTDLIDNYIKKS